MWPNATALFNMATNYFKSFSQKVKSVFLKEFKKKKYIKMWNDNMTLYLYTFPRRTIIHGRNITEEQPINITQKTQEFSTM